MKNMQMMVNKILQPRGQFSPLRFQMFGLTALCRSILQPFCNTNRQLQSLRNRKVLAFSYFLIFTFLFLVGVPNAFGNNVRLGSSVRIVEVGASEATIEVTVSWDHSWRDGYNNDAVWLFFKYRTATSGWESVSLPETAQVSENYMAMPGYTAGSVVGYFVYRSVAGSGDASTTFRFKWIYPSGVDREMFENNQIFLMAQGVEMVYIPYGGYTLGDGASNLAFASSGTGISITGNEDALPGSPSSNFPRGFEGFYVMKYELSQEQYVAFVNSLSRSGQLELLPQLASLAKGDYVFGSPNKVSCRNGIVVSVPLTDTKAAVLDNNLSGDGTLGGQDDGRTLACNYLSPLDLLGYMSWSGLRPLTEIEYEKSCRRLLPYRMTPKDYAWGTNNISFMSGIQASTSGWADEIPLDGWVNAGGHFGPVRCGAFASIGNNRESAGSTYAGVMEMSGNVGELCLNVSASGFDGGLHGSGSYYTGEWGSFPASAFGLRGGSFISPRERLRVSDRTDAQSNYFTSLTQRDSTVGFRGVRMLDRTGLGFTAGEILYNDQKEAVVCSGMPFTVKNIKDAGSPVLSGLQVTYKWFVNGKEIPYETGNSLTYPGGIYNTAKEDSVYRFSRRAYSFLGELGTEAVVITVPGKMELSLPSGTGQLRLACNVTSPVTASRLSDTRYRWVNASSGKVVKDWSSPAKTDSYSPLHSDFGYMGALSKLRCVSDVNGCKDSAEISLTVESSCYLVVDSTLLHMTTNTNGGTAVASLCGPGTVKWYYKDNGGKEHLISTANVTASGNTTPQGIPLFYTTSYRPKYADFQNTIGDRMVIVRSSLGDDSRCTDLQELKVDVKATLDPGKVSAPALACSNVEIMIDNVKNAGVEGMSGLLPVYSWYVNGSSMPLANQSGPTLKYRLPANTADRAVAHTFVRKAVTAAPLLQTPYGDTVRVSIPGVPSVTLMPPVPFCDNTNLPFPVPAINWAGLEGQGAWSLNGGAVPSPVKYANNGQELRYTISNTCHAPVKSNGVSITVYPPTLITTQPVGQVLCQGETISLSIAASGRDLKYQWQKNDENIAGATSAFYTKTGVVPNDGGRYRCVVTGTCGSVASSYGMVTVHPTTSISVQPGGTTLCQGGTFTVATTAVGSGLSYQWQKNGGNIGTGVSYTKGSATPSDGGNYRCLVNGTCGSATTNTVMVTVNASTVITSQPSGQTICQGSTISLSTSASGAGISYQWQKNGGTVGYSSYYSKGGAVPGDGGSYRCYISGSCGSGYTNTVTVTVNASTVITSQPSGQNICQGSTISLGTAASGTNVSYQWQKNGGTVGYGSYYSKGGAVPGDGGSYRCYVTGTCGSAYTNTVGVTVNAPVVYAGSVYANPGSVCTGGGFTLTNSGNASATCGYGITNYEWYRSDGAFVGNGVSLHLSNYGNGTYYFSRRAYTSTGAYANTGYIAVTVASCGPPTINVNGRLWTANDICTSCNWYEAFTVCANIGMRLPNNDDWYALAGSNNSLGVPRGCYYWSATQIDGKRGYPWDWIGYWSCDWNRIGHWNKGDRAGRVRCVK